MATVAEAWLPLALLAMAAGGPLGLLVLIAGLWRVFRSAPQLAPLPPSFQPLATSLLVVIPAYNEARNIADCLTAVLDNAPAASQFQVVVVDDSSRDGTAAIAEATAAQHPSGACFQLLRAGERPAAERWVGKNWACSRACEQFSSEWVLFVDADVRLMGTTLARALQQAVADQADLLSLAPRLECSCWAEWMVQPIVASLLGLGFPITAANDPADATAFAAGPFMLFRRSAYDAIGGHRGLAAVVVEDLALARLIKGSGYRLRYLLGLDGLTLQMYADLASLWEGWSKNWFLGLDGNIAKALGASAAVFVMFAGPWLLLPCSFLGLWWQPQWLLLWQSSALLCAAGIGLQWCLRYWSQRTFGVPMRHWWWMGAGGCLLAALGPTSVWRSLTGRGWTWKGRSLS